MKISRNKKGFTLIELLIVVAIIGILAAIAIPAYTGYTKKAKVAGIVHTMGAIKNAVVAYYTEAGAFYTAGNLSSSNATGANSIKAILGVDPSEQYAVYTVTATTGVITAAPLATLDIGGNLILTPSADFKNWNWDASTCESTYKPKS